jgi:hypothetical protein
MNKITIIIRILFAVTLFQHSPLTRRVFFNNIRRERSASSVASGGQYRQYHLETLASTFTSHQKFSSSATSSFSKECHHHLHQYVSIKKRYLIITLGWHITVLHWLNVTADKLVAQCQSHLALRLTTRSEARNTSSSCFTSNNEVKSKESSCFTSNN